MMYKQEPIQNEKCAACRFCSWQEEYQEYRCNMRGCIENSLFVEYQGKYVDGKYK